MKNSHLNKTQQYSVIFLTISSKNHLFSVKKIKMQIYVILSFVKLQATWCLTWTGWNPSCTTTVLMNLSSSKFSGSHIEKQLYSWTGTIPNPPSSDKSLWVLRLGLNVLLKCYKSYAHYLIKWSSHTRITLFLYLIRSSGVSLHFQNLSNLKGFLLHKKEWPFERLSFKSEPTL